MRFSVKAYRRFKASHLYREVMIAIMFADRQTPVLLCCYGNAEQIALQSYAVTPQRSCLPRHHKEIRSQGIVREVERPQPWGELHHVSSRVLADALEDVDHRW